MTAYQFIALGLLAAAATSCDKARDLADKTRTAVEAKMGAGGGENAADPDLEELVDRTEDGVRFRSDLPFPNRLEVRTVRNLRLDVRNFEDSALGRESSVTKATRTTVTKAELSGDRIRHVREKTTLVQPAPAGAEDAAAPEQAGPPGRPLNLRRSANRWEIVEDGNFATAALARDLRPFLGPLIIESGLAPRRMWFGKRRLKPGDTVEVSGPRMPMLVAGKATGRLQLKLESFEPVHGHPCAVFSIRGSFTRPEFADFEGVFSDEDISIKSGRIWASLLHPLILREELETIQTVKYGNRRNPTSRLQGKVGVSILREWKSPPKKSNPS